MNVDAGSQQQHNPGFNAGRSGGFDGSRKIDVNNSALISGNKIDAAPAAERASWSHAGTGGAGKIDANTNITFNKSVDNSKNIGVYNDHPTYNVDNSKKIDVNNNINIAKNIDNSKRNRDVYKDNRHTPTSTIRSISTSTSR